MTELPASCPSCGKPLSVPSNAAEPLLACPACGTTVLPVGEGAAPEPAGKKHGGAVPFWIVALVLVLGGGFAVFKVLKDRGILSTTPENLPAGVVKLPPATETDTVPRTLDWPQWRGPGRDGHSQETGLLTEWPADGPPLLWRVKGCGSGYSSVAVAGGRVFTLGDGSDGLSHVHCFDEASGEKLWSSEGVGKIGGNYDGTKSTPCLDGEHVYALGQFGDLVCLEAASGNVIWRKSLPEDFSGEPSGWNYAESPLVDGDRLVVSPGGGRGLMVALNKSNGSLIWRTTDWTDEVQYVSPIISMIGGRRHYVQLTRQTLAGVDAETGDLLWSIGRHGETAVIPTPVIHGNVIFVTSGYRVGCNAFRITGEGRSLEAEALYANQEMINHHGGIVRVGNHVFGHSDRRDWKCIDIATGQVLWANRGVGKGSVIYADGHLYCRGESGSGEIALVRASPEGYVETGRFDQPGRSRKNSWAHPAIANGKLFLRDQELLLCYDIKAR